MTAAGEGMTGCDTQNITCDVAVVGAGPAGIAAALAFNHVGTDVALIGPERPETSAARGETRTAALLNSSVDFLIRLGVWDALRPEAAPLKVVRIVDASGSLIRSPDIAFKASDLGLAAFGYNIANTALTASLYARARDVLPKRIAESVGTIQLDDQAAHLTLSGGRTVTARLLAGADGRRSVCREAAGIETSAWGYDQGAIASRFHHTEPHRGVSTELHKERGSLTTVPMSDPLQSALIWIGPPEETDALMACDEAAFAAHLQDRLGDTLGGISAIGQRAAFPVAGINARKLAHNRTALIGEAAHVMPPIGAQGLNLGLRDAAALADCVADAVRQGHDPGGRAVLANYIDARKLDVLSRAVGVDLLNRSLLTSLIPVQAARGVFLAGLNAFAPLRRLVMRVGLEPPSSLPSLMRPAARETGGVGTAQPA
jgi:2-octaprenyl-6-methoxyphenol hydroxylase